MMTQPYLINGRSNREATYFRAICICWPFSISPSPFFKAVIPCENEYISRWCDSSRCRGQDAIHAPVYGYESDPVDIPEAVLFDPRTAVKHPFPLPITLVSVSMNVPGYWLWKPQFRKMFGLHFAWIHRQSGHPANVDTRNSSLPLPSHSRVLRQESPTTPAKIVHRRETHDPDRFLFSGMHVSWAQSFCPTSWLLSLILFYAFSHAALHLRAAARWP